jgi:tRNA/tmRNA/rRNA uracil-C5-methylase (TrmA/RlmC/RlmD family)
MEKTNKVLFLFSAFLFFLISFWLTSADAGVFKYTDKDGTLHFTDSYESIPPQYRNQVETMKEPMPQTSPQPAEQGEGRGMGAAVRPEEVQKDVKETEALKRKDAELKAAQEKEAQEKEALERKLKAREEKEAQIEELRRQIEAKQQEQRTLYSNPMMVRDRNQFTQLNQEISEIHRQIQGLQSEMDSER